MKRVQQIAITPLLRKKAPSEISKQSCDKRNWNQWIVERKAWTARECPISILYVTNYIPCSVSSSSSFFSKLDGIFYTDYSEYAFVQNTQPSIFSDIWSHNQPKRDVNQKSSNNYQPQISNKSVPMMMTMLRLKNPLSQLTNK